MNLQRIAVAGAANLAFFAAVAVGTVLSLPTTWIVDDDGGPGVNFTDIQPAIDAALDGDLILVRAGSYGGIFLTKDLTILGDPGALAGNATLKGIDVQATLASLEFVALWVTDCPGTVVLDELVARNKFSHDSSIEVKNSADVRLYELYGGSAYSRFALSVQGGSRLEAVRSSFFGDTGKAASGSSAYGGDGEPAVRVLGGSRVHVARSALRGGVGGSALLPVIGYGGQGGAGLDVTDGTVILTGRGGDLSQGGKGGDIALYGYSGGGGDGARVEAGAKLRYSNVLLRGGKCGGPGFVPCWSGPGARLAVLPGGTAVQPGKPDPTLERLDPPVAGGVVQLKLRAEPGSFARLFVGSQPIVHASPNVVIEKLVVPDTTLSLGIVPANGILNYGLPLDPAWTPGTVVHLQAMAVYSGGKIRRTNSVPLVVREP